MVMETPSPQCVGLEFVRQYYTVLNKAPVHLHRFYSHNSLFTHGGPSNVNDPTVGQADIHKKILSLNFQDCHAKIRMVDAHATLGDGVVIQVTGELSNNGMPMRRFMQSFVLAPQSPKKYYVHNDIFRYQDDVFSDDEPTEEGCSDPEEDLDTIERPIYNSATVNGTHNHNHNQQREQSPVVAVPAPTHNQSPIQVTPTSTPAPAPVPVQIPVSPPVATPVPAPVASIPRPSTPPQPENEGWSTPSVSAEEWTEPIEETPPAPKPKKETPVKPPPPEPAQTTPQPQPVSNEPKTFANLFKNTSGFTNNSSSVTSSISTYVQEPTPHSGRNSHSYSSQSTRSESVNRPSSTFATSPSVAPSTQSSGTNSRLSRNFHDDDKRRSTVPDTQQVFVGNLPHAIGEDQLRNEFNQYGKILEIRINTGKGKAGAKGPGGHQVPNFGFIAFEDENAVMRCLNARPIYLGGDNRINVEEKKARSRVESGGGRPSGGRGGLGSSGGGMRGGQGSRGGGGGGGGSGRGGGGSFSRDNSRGGSTSSRGSYAPRR